MHRFKKVYIGLLLLILVVISTPKISSMQQSLIEGSSFKVLATQVYKNRGSNSNRDSNHYRAVKQAQQQATIKGDTSSKKSEVGVGHRGLETFIIMVLVGSIVYLLYDSYVFNKNVVSGSVAELKFKIGGK